MTGQRPSISTGKGDAGQTLTIECLSLPKYHPCIHFYGSIDKTLAMLGYVISVSHHFREELEYIYKILENLVSSFYKQEPPKFRVGDVEERMKKYDIKLRGFIPNYLIGTPDISLLALVRTSIRESERWYWACVNEMGLEDKGIGPILNRLSDFVFLLQARLYKRELRKREVPK